MVALALWEPTVIERAITVLRAELTTELAAVGAGVPLLPLPGPTTDAFFPLPADDELVGARLIRTRQQAMYVYQLGTPVQEEQISGGVTERQAIVSQSFACTLLFGQVQYTPFVWAGATVIPDTVMTLRAQYYGAAITNTLQKHWADGPLGSILHVDVENLSPTVFADPESDRVAAGIAHVETTVWGIVTIPNQTHSV